MIETLLAIFALSQAAGNPQSPATAPAMKVEDVTRGGGPVLKDGDLVTVHYVATTLEGRQIANSEIRGVPMRFVIGEPGAPEYMVRAVNGMRRNGERKVTLPPELAFGAEGARPIVPPNTTLILQIRIVEVTQPASDDGAQR